MKNFKYLVAAILLCELVGILSTPFTIASIPTWYATLVKPVFSPPNWVFGPVWTILYALMGVSLYLIWIQRGQKSNQKNVQLGLRYFFTQLAVNFIWSLLFFGLRSPILGLIDIVILWILIIRTMFVFEKLSKQAVYLLIPYFLWVSFATALNATIVILNPASKAPSRNIDRIISGSFDENKIRSNDEWKRILTNEQYYILRQQGTEIPFTGELNGEKRAGTYFSVGCNEPAFRSEQKYDSGTGWPSFWAPIGEKALVLMGDGNRIEVLDRCGGHLGHVFDDGPEPTGKRYCMNSIALYFVPD